MIVPALTCYVLSIPHAIEYLQGKQESHGAVRNARSFAKAVWEKGIPGLSQNLYTASWMDSTKLEAA